MPCNGFGLGSCAVEGFYVGPLRRVWFLQCGSEGRLRLVSKNWYILNGSELFFWWTEEIAPLSRIRRGPLSKMSPKSVNLWWGNLKKLKKHKARAPILAFWRLWLEWNLKFPVFGFSSTIAPPPQGPTSARNHVGARAKTFAESMKCAPQATAPRPHWAGPKGASVGFFSGVRIMSELCNPIM